MMPDVRRVREWMAHAMTGIPRRVSSQVRWFHMDQLIFMIGLALMVMGVVCYRY